VAAVLTGITNATSESLNRLAKLEARQAYGFRNPLNQQRRVRIACTRGNHRQSHTAAPRREHPVTGRQPDPGYCTVTLKSLINAVDPAGAEFARNDAEYLHATLLNGSSSGGKQIICSVLA